MSASRGARVGTKAGRVVRIIRLIRLIRIVKLYKHAQNVIEEGTEKEKILPLPMPTAVLTSQRRKSNSDSTALKIPKPSPPNNNGDVVRPSLQDSVRSSMMERRGPSARKSSIRPSQYRRA